MGIVNNPVFDVLERVLDISSRRASLVAANIANVDTPGYKAKTFDFDEALASFLPEGQNLQPVRTDPSHIGGVSESDLPSVREEAPLTERLDENTVDIERELSDLLRSEIMYSASLRLLTKKIQMINSAIAGG